VEAAHDAPTANSPVSTDGSGIMRFPDGFDRRSDVIRSRFRGKAHPHWGARKILAWLKRKHPELELPVPSTVNAVFAKYGLSRTKQALRRTPPYTEPFADSDAPNRIWPTPAPCSDAALASKASPIPRPELKA
jgi:hypothetical protein